MNICLVIVDSLRFDALGDGGPSLPCEALGLNAVRFDRAYATECWTLPSHVSMFTGLLPSQHGAHLQSMGYTGPAETIAEVLSEEGYSTELVTRNPIFDGTIPGVTRGFRKNTKILSELRGLNHMSIMLALSKPRFRRQIQSTGFFHDGHRANREFVSTFARTTVPADREALQHVALRMVGLRRQKRPFFFFVNLFDVHAPYPPSERSIFRSVLSRQGLSEFLRLPRVLPRLGAHTYLRRGFEMADQDRQVLLGRYRSAVTLMNRKLVEFCDTISAEGILDDTLLIITSDHGEAFGEHGLYLHDASVWQTHLHVPLLVHHPEVVPHLVDDSVSTRDLFGLMRSVGVDSTTKGTILDPCYRAANPIVIAEHFYSPYAVDAEEKHRQNLVAALCGEHKVIRRREGNLHFDLDQSPNEAAPIDDGSLEAFERACRSRGASSAHVEDAMQHLKRWSFERKCSPCPDC